MGTGKYASNEQTVAALDASGTECVTVALRRVDLKRESGPNLLDALGDRWTLLPNTAGCFTGEDAIRTCRLARELGIADLVKLEVLADPESLLPDTEETLKALRDARRRGLHRARLHERRPRRRPQARGGGRRGRHAARERDRHRARAS